MRACACARVRARVCVRACACARAYECACAFVSVCVLVCTPFSDSAAGSRPKLGTRVRIDLGMVRTETKLPPPLQGGPVGSFRSTFQSPGNVMNCRENHHILLTPITPGCWEF